MTRPAADMSDALAPDANRSSTRTRPEPGDCFTADVAMRWGDMDAQAHLNNAVYFRLMEEARIQMMHRSGVPYPPDRAIVLAHASCDFLRPVVYPAVVRIVQRVVRIGRSSAELELTLGDANHPETPLYARARNVLVWMDLKAGTSAAWAPEILSGLAQHLRRPDEPAALDSPQRTL